MLSTATATLHKIREFALFELACRRPNPRPIDLPADHCVEYPQEPVRGTVNISGHLFNLKNVCLPEGSHKILPAAKVSRETWAAESSGSGNVFERRAQAFFFKYRAGRSEQGQAIPGGVLSLDLRCSRSHAPSMPFANHGFSDAQVPARLLARLVSVENSHLCGQVIFVDGGSDASVRGDSVW